MKKSPPAIRRLFLAAVSLLMMLLLLLPGCRTVGEPTEVLTSEAPPKVRLNLKFYGHHTEEVDRRIFAIRPEYLVDNPLHGLWGEIQGYDTPWLLQNIKPFQSSAIRVIGYLTAGYEGRFSGGKLDPRFFSLEMNRKLISNMASLDGVDGVFIDECSAFPDDASKAYLSSLSSLAHELGLLVWGNTGERQFSGWFFEEGGFDFMQSTEDWHGEALSPVQLRYGSRISVTGFRPYYSLEDAVSLTVDAWEKGLAFCYINNDEYTSIAPWFEAYADRIRKAKMNYRPVPPRPEKGFRFVLQRLFRG